MKENCLLPLAKREEIEIEINKNWNNSSDFIWSEEESGKRIPQTNFSARFQTKVKTIVNTINNSSPPLISLLLHKKSEAFITFDILSNKRLSNFSLGLDYDIEQKEFDSIDEQVAFAIKWIQELKNNFIEESENPKPQEITENPVIASQNESIESKEVSKDIEKAKKYFDDVKSELSQIEELTDKSEKQRKEKILIKKAEDSIKLFGNEGQEEKVDLEEIIEKLKLNQPPESSADLLKRGQKHLIKKGWNLLPPKLWLAIAIIAVIIFALVPFLSWLSSISKNELIENSSNLKQPSNTNSNISVMNNTNNSQNLIQNSQVKNTNEAIIKDIAKPETLNIHVNESEKSSDGKVIISLVGISFEKTSSGTLGHKITATINSRGYKPIRILREEVGYIIIYKADVIYEIQIESSTANSASFSITRLNATK